MFKYTFSDGTVVTSQLKQDVMLQRMRRLDILRVLTEQIENPQAQNICRKAVNAYNKLDGFTGVIRLTASEKDWLGYLLESDMLSDKDRECINWYLGIR